MANPVLQYLVAFNNNAFDDPALITTVATPPGTVGANNVWTDITRYVVDDAGNRGRQHELQQFQAGDRTLTLRNDDGRFTPWNTSGPYTGLVVPRKPFQVRAVWSAVTYTRFTGQVYSWQVNWPDAAQQTVTLTAGDALRIFNGADITSGGYPAQVVTDGAVGYWRLGDTVGSTRAADSSGNGNTGVPIGGYPFPVFGQTGGLISNPGSSALFTAVTSGVSNDCAVSYPANIVPSGAGAWSGEFWFNGDSASSAVDQTGINTSFTLTGTPYVLGVAVIFSPSKQIAVTDGTTLVVVTQNIWDGKWHHIVGTASLTTGFGLYCDGVQIATSAANMVTLVAVSPSIIYSGSESPGSLLQEAAVYPTALTPTQVTNHFQLAAWPQESTGSRVGRTATAVGWSTGARAIDTGVSTVQATTGTLTSTSSLNHMQQCEATEGGALFMGNTGKLTFYARSTLQTGATFTTSQATFGNNTGGGDIPYQPAPTLARDDIDLYNEAVATRTGGITQITPPSGTNASIVANGRVTWNPPAALIGISDSEVLNLTQYIVSRYATPVDRLAQIVVDLTSLAADLPAVVPTLLSLELLNLVTVERTSMPGGGTSFSQQNVIEHISETIHAADGMWTVTFGMARTDVSWWILGTSQLGINNTLAW